MTIDERLGTAAVSLRRDIAPARGLTVDERWLVDGISDPLPLSALDGSVEAMRMAVAIQRLWSAGRLELVDDPIEPRLTCVPLVPGQRLPLTVVDDDVRYRMSRFAVARRAMSGLIVENPRVPFRVHADSSAAPELFAFAEMCRLPELAEHIAGRQVAQIRGAIVVLCTAGVIAPCGLDGSTPDDLDPAAQQWEVHDLLFHSRSRQGLHSDPIGAHYRWRGVLEAQPAIPDNSWRDRAVVLPQPDMEAVRVNDARFTDVLEKRTSRRDHHPFVPIGLGQLAEFLFRVGRIRARFDTEFGEFTSRPYPSGGASYELELYVTANQCAGLGRGFYYYDAAEHTLCLVAPPTPDVEGLLDDAWQSSAYQCRPQVLITIASRFARVSWKYSGMAYATQLKNCGVLMQTMYLVATAMGLAPSALGLGNIERFARITGLDRLVQGSIGEFMLGIPLPTPG
jgi:SagB-type dehydrogenase family enzyme